jgi:para-nitrobenzyl esterase
MMNRMLHRIRAALCGSILMAVVAACGGSNGPGNPPPPPGQVTTTEGVYQGRIEGGLVVFRGIRYAAAPLGDLRFKAPQPAPAFNGVRDADAFGAVCTQASNAGMIGDEDCLFLNIWAHDDDVVRPVMVYLHPGAAEGVGGSMSSIDGAALAESGGIVVVNLNRRIGALAYLAIDELVQEDPRSTAGNYGTLDVIAALRWVQDNIAAFNGDPNRVMVSGTSAGGAMLCHVIAAPEAMGLFSAISLQSAGCSGRIRLTAQIPYPSRFPPAIDEHRGILPLTGCDAAADILDCLRNLSAAEVNEAGDVLSDMRGYDVFRPVIDGVVVQSDPYDALANQVVGDIPLIVGSTADEARFLFAQLDIPDDATYRSLLATIFPDPLDDELYALYPTADFPTPKDAFLTLFGDRIFSCVAEELARSAVGGAPSYLYHITRAPESGLPADHAIDIPYLFATYDQYGLTPDAQGLDIGTAIQGAWASLAADPMAVPPYLPQGASAWPAFDVNDNNYVDFGNTIEPRNGHRADRCETLKTIVDL